MRSSKCLWDDCYNMLKYKYLEMMLRPTGKFAWKRNHCHCPDWCQPIMCAAARIWTCFAFCDTTSSHTTAATWGTQWCHHLFLHSPQATTVTFVDKVDSHGGTFLKMLHVWTESLPEWILLVKPRPCVCDWDEKEVVGEDLGDLLWEQSVHIFK